MNLKEALQALIDGKKIRNKNWAYEKTYVYLKNDQLYRSDNTLCTLNFIDCTGGWEIYEEPKKPIDFVNDEFYKYSKCWQHDDPVCVITAIVKYLNEKENERK